MATDTTVQLSDSGHLPCGNVPFHKGVCRDAYLKRRTCEHCEHLVSPADDTSSGSTKSRKPSTKSADGTAD